MKTRTVLSFHFLLFLSVSGGWAQPPSYVPSENLAVWNSLSQSAVTAVQADISNGEFVDDRFGAPFEAFGTFPSDGNINVPNSDGGGLMWPIPAVQDAFTMAFWVSPNREINLIGESSSCSGTVSVPLAFTVQNWAIRPMNGLDSGLSIGLSVGTNGVVLGAHASNVLVSHLTHSTELFGWHHVAISCDDQAYMLFIDGEMVQSTSNPCPGDLISYTGAGAFNTGEGFIVVSNSLYSAPFDGTMDELGMWNEVLSESEIEQLFNGQPATESDTTGLCQVTTDDMLAWYPFNAGEATNQVADSLHGEVVGSPTLTTDRFGNPDAAWHFDAAEDFITVPGSQGVNPFPFSISLWFQPDEDFPAPGNTPLFKKYAPAAWNGIQVGYSRTPDGEHRVVPWYLRSYNQRLIGEYGGEEPFDWVEDADDGGIWHHAVFTADSAGGHLYIDGELVSTDTWTGDPAQSTSNFLWQIGGGYEVNDSLGYNGAIDDLGIWGRTLDVSEVEQLYLCDGYIPPTGVIDCSDLSLSSNVSLTDVCAGESIEVEVVIAGSTGVVQVEDTLPLGGIVYYDKGFESDGWRYLAMDTADAFSTSVGMQCYCVEIDAYGDVGTGYDNMLAWNDSSCSYVSMSVLEDNLTSPVPWHIPSIGELEILYQNMSASGLYDFPYHTYVSSTPGNYGSCGIDGGHMQVNFETGMAYPEYRWAYAGSGSLRLVRYVSESEVGSSLECIWSNGQTGLTTSFIAEESGTLEATVYLADGDTCVLSTAIEVSDCIEDCISPTMDGYTYDVVQIGDQCWFAENLRTSIYRNGDSIPEALNSMEWSSTMDGASAIYGMMGGNCAYAADACDPDWSLQEYGRLYNAFAVAENHGLCPTGWHVPTDNEWKQMELGIGLPEDQVDSTGNRGQAELVGASLKLSTGWWTGNGTDIYDFGGKPSGYRYWSNGALDNAGLASPWWTATADGEEYWWRSLYHSSSGIQRGTSEPNTGHAVRCILGDCLAMSLGCTDPDACNYDALASDDDGSCSQLQVTEVVGLTEVEAGTVTTYAAVEAAIGNSYEWTVTGGEITAGQGTPYVVVAWNEAGDHSISVVESNADCGEATITVAVSVTEVMGVGETTGSAGLAVTVAPNPFRSDFTLLMTLPRHARVAPSLWDMNGKRIQNSMMEPLPVGEHALHISTANLPAGIYAVRVRFEGEGWTESKVLRIVKE